MCNYKMDINGEINASYYETICDYMEIINDKDSFAISINGINKNNIDMIYTILNDNRFKIHNEGYNSKGIYNINAYKIS